jgi:hypothetical protein
MFSPQLVLAFGFGSPLMLWGLGAGGIPILIHLLHRRKFKTVQWAAMRFLLAATKKQSRRLKLEQLILLIVRTLIVVFIALAFARPTAETLGEYFQSEGPRHRIVVIDATYSMGYAPSGKTRLNCGSGKAGRRRQSCSHQRFGPARHRPPARLSTGGGCGRNRSIDLAR